MTIPINRNTTIFFNVDTQVDFMDKDGVLYIDESDEIKNTLVNLTNFATENHIRVINTMNWHYMDCDNISDYPDFSVTFPPHCMANTVGCEFIEETLPKNSYTIDWSINMGLDYLPNNRNIIIRKNKYDFISGNPNSNRILDILKRGGIKTIVIYGVSENISINLTINHLLNKGFEVIAIENGIKGLSNMESPKDIWIDKGVEIVNFEDLSLE